MKKRLLISILLLLAFTSCSIYSVDPSVTYIIKKGDHYAGYYTFQNKYKDTSKKIAPIWLRGNRIEFKFSFNDTNKYDFSVKDGLDINKLYGITSTKIHENSARIGWRYTGDDNFEVFAYYYVRGVRGWTLLGTYKTRERLTISIDVSKHEYTYVVNNEWFSVYNTKNILAARAFPYFGGDNVAPHKMIFLITEI